MTIIPRFLGERPERADTVPAVGAGVVSLSLYKPCPFWVLREGESRGGRHDAGGLWVHGVDLRRFYVLENGLDLFF